MTNPTNIANHEMNRAGQGAMNSSAELMRYLENIQELPTLSSVAIRVNSLLQNIDTTARELADVIEKDQAMVGKLLKLSNSSFFGFSSKVSNVAHAVMILGFNTVFNAILSMAVIDALGTKSKLQGMDMTDFWRHSISVAVISKYLSRFAGGHRHDNAFTAGILHDIGKVVMARFFPDRFSDLWGTMMEEDVSFTMAEKQFFPLGHDAIGAYLSRVWNLPEELSSSIAQHHQPKLMPQPDVLVLVVNTADGIVNVHMEGRLPVEQWSISNAAKMLLGEKIRTVEHWLPEIQDEIKAACDVILE